MRILKFISCFIFLLSCKDSGQEKSHDIAEDSKDSLLHKYGMPYSNLSVDSNSLVFYSLNNFDTSFLVHLQREGGYVSGIYYQVVPTYHRSVTDYANKENKLIFLMDLAL
jgi:hypothetical protein